MLWTALAGKLLIGALLLLGGGAKVVAGSEWRVRWLTAYGIVPARLSASFALTIALIEVASGLLMALGVTPWVAAFVLASTTAVAIRALSWKDRPDCGCFGRVFNRVLSWRLAARNAFLVVVICDVALVPTPSLIAWQQFTSI